ILLTTHYMEEADQLCNRVAIMDHGRILALDTPEQLKSSLGAATEVRMQAPADALAGLAAMVGGLPGVKDTQVVDSSVVAWIGADGPRLPELIGQADRAGFAIRDVGITEPTLETVFISLTGRDLRE